MDGHEEYSQTISENSVSPEQTIGDSFRRIDQRDQAKKKFRVKYPPNQSIIEKVVEHFEFIPINFIDEITNSANDSIYQLTNELKTRIESQLGVSEETDKAIHELETLLEHSVDNAFDHFELYALRNIFNIPDGLEKYIEFPYSNKHAVSENGVDSNEKVQELVEVYKDLYKEKQLGVTLENTLSELEHQVKALRDLDQALKQINLVSENSQSDGSGISPQEMADNLTRIQAQLNQISSVSSQIEKLTRSDDFIKSTQTFSGIDKLISHFDV